MAQLGSAFAELWPDRQQAQKILDGNFWQVRVSGTILASP